MKNIKLTVDGNVIRCSPTCDFSGLFPGMQEPVCLEFDFPSEWKKRMKVVAFWSMLGSEYPPRELKDGKSCMVPSEALKRAAFKVQIFGKHDGVTVSTHKFTIFLKGGDS